MIISLLHVLACSPSPTRLLVHVPHECLLTAAANRQQHAVSRRRTNVGEERLRLSLDRSDPVPLMAVAAVLAAAGPPIVNAFRRASRIRPRRRASSLPPSSGSPIVRPDGTLDDERTVATARRLLDKWRDTAVSGPSDSIDSSLAEAALGLAMLDFSETGADDMQAFRQVRALCSNRQQGGLEGEGCTLGGALRKATTAAARRTYGRGRDGSALSAATRETACGALLLLCRVLLEGNPAEAATVAMQIRLAFGLSDAFERAAQLRDAVARRLFRSEARRALAQVGSLRGELPSATAQEAALQQVRAALDPLPTSLGLDASHFLAALLSEAAPTLASALEVALEEWTALGGTATATSPPGRLIHQGSYLRAAAAARLAWCCLGLGGEMVGRMEGEAPLAELSSVGLQSAARHSFYTALVRQAAIDEIERTVVGSAAGFNPVAGALDEGAQESAYGATRAQTTGLCVVEDAAVLVRMLGVLPVTATAAANGALEAAASRARERALTLTLPLGLAAHPLEELAQKLGVPRQRAASIIADAMQDS